ncbi:MAG: hypothetical protein GX094_07380 [Clostridiales bacterium]|nr:hypothetical protein [Clostridiales bacterium]
MISLKNHRLGLYCMEDGRGMSINDFLTGETWTLDESSLVYGGVDNSKGRKAALNRLELKKAEIVGEDRIKLRLQAGAGHINLIFVLGSDYIEVILPADQDDKLGIISMPGSFFPAGGKARYLLPIMQGMLWDGRGEPFETKYGEAAHGGFSMAMFGVLGRKGGLLCAAETYDDCLWWVGKDVEGRTWAANLQVDSLGSMRYERRVRLYPVKASITDVAKTYRRRVIERGRFLSWEEKIKERPALKRLFGAIMCFIGYCQDDIDYVKECRKLKAYGFDKALIYPVRFNTYSKNFLMGGYPPIYLDRDVIQKIKELGYDVAPWSWLNEGLDDGSGEMRIRYRKNRAGEMILGWQIDAQRWYRCCSSSMPEYQYAANAQELSDMTWDHFDVITCDTVDECHALDHPNHLGRPLSKTEDREWIRKLLIAGQNGSRPVSSENFNDAFSMEYDMGSVKAWAQYGPWTYWPIPLTMLVYHDSMIHTWWEPHNYNSRYHARDTGKYQYGGGRPRLMAAMDALYGCPPDVFPFGAMYEWTGRGRETMLYKFRFEDKVTQFALEQALPVAKLHEKIGMLEMTNFEFLSEDGYVQKTEFADGTRVYANFGCGSFYIDGVGPLTTESWKAIRGE